MSFTTSTTLGEKPDLVLSAHPFFHEYIDVEQYLYNHSYYNAANIEPFIAPCPRWGDPAKRETYSSEAQAQINVLRGQDTRKDLGHYSIVAARISSMR